MTDLTATEYSRIRRRTGADSTSEMPDTELQYHYDLAVADTTDDTTLTLPYTYVFVLRDLWGIRSTLVDRTTDHGDHEIRSQIRDATKTLLDYWETQTGLIGGVGGQMQSGLLDLNLDTDCDDLTDALASGEFFFNG